MVVWGIASSEDADTVERYANFFGLTYPILLDTTGEVNMDYAMEMSFSSALYPQDWVIGTDGVVVYANNAFEADEIQAAIDRELAEKR